MPTIARESELQVLGRILQNRLQSAKHEHIPFQVRCATPQEALIILTQHPPDFAPDAQQTFREIEQTLKTLRPEFANQVQLYLRIAGQKQPYAFHSFTVESPVLSTVTADSVDEGVVFDTAGVPSGVKASATQSSLGDTDATDVEEPPAIAESSSGAEDEPVSPAVPPEGSKGKALPLVTKLRQLPLPLLVAGAGVGLLAFILPFYALTRPCVVGPCVALTDAKQLSQEAAVSLQKPKSGQEILEAREKQQEAIRLLETIPFWSLSYQEAQNQLKDDSQQAQLLEQLVTGLSKGSTAAQRSQNPPHSVAEWGEIQQMWREAIALLEPVPRNSTVYQLAQQKIKEYRVNLAAINWRLNAERKALQDLDAAKEALKVAEARQGVAQSLTDWRLVETSWDMGMNRLKGIPVGTTARAEAQQMIAAYLPKLANARDRKNREQMAINNYKMAQNLARNAKNTEQLNQWTLTVLNWRNAIVNLQKIPRGTFVYNQADSLLNSYKEALRQAEIKLSYANLLQKARNDLNRTCTGAPKVCDYTVTDRGIRVQLTPAYMQMVVQTTNTAKQRGDFTAQQGIATHLRTLGDALEAISDNARVPLQLYTPDGALINSYPRSG